MDRTMEHHAEQTRREPVAWDYETLRLEPLPAIRAAHGASDCHDGIYESMCDFNADAECTGGEFE